MVTGISYTMTSCFYLCLLILLPSMVTCQNYDKSTQVHNDTITTNFYEATTILSKNSSSSDNSSDKNEKIITRIKDITNLRCSRTEPEYFNQLGFFDEFRLQPSKDVQINGVCFYSIQAISENAKLLLTCKMLLLAGPTNGRHHQCNRDETFHIVDGLYTTILCGEHKEGITYRSSTWILDIVLYGPANGTNSVSHLMIQDCTVKVAWL